MHLQALVVASSVKSIWCVSALSWLSANTSVKMSVLLKENYISSGCYMRDSTIIDSHTTQLSYLSQCEFKFINLQ